MQTASSSHEPWRECYRQLAPKLLLFARQWAPSMADAEDVVQTAFVRFWRKQPEAQPEHYPLLYAAVRTVALDLLRTNERRGRREDAFGAEAPTAEEPLFAATLDQRADAELLQTALARLSHDQREAVVLRIWGGLTFAQIAETLGESINTVAARYRYALEALRRHMPHPDYERVRA
jgi:RNA polymerase sigma-70 factor (ECF subfamily)